MPEIRQLPTSVINKIAAGEVIERPASVVKELVENSVDAGATRIDVTIEKGGTDLIRIADNGCGIHAEQLELAVSPHATSKIFSADDLFSVASMGFRGEALASIAEVSQFLIRSRVPESASGYQLLVNGGERQPIDPCGCPVGTVMEVRNLFFNTPVRRKFLKTPQTELGHIVEAFTRIALAYPSVHFTLSHNQRMVHELPPTVEWSERIGHFFGEEIRQNLISVDSQHEDVRLTGFAVAPTVSRSHNRMQYLFLNGRFIRDRSLQHALSESYRGLLMTGRFPIVFLRLTMPADQVDVNVHPAKLEVRFQESGKLYSQLLGTLRSRFLSADLSEKVRSANQPGTEIAASESADDGVSSVSGKGGWGEQISATQVPEGCEPSVLQRTAARVERWARQPGEGVQTTLPVAAPPEARAAGWTSSASDPLALVVGGGSNQTQFPPEAQVPQELQGTQELSGQADGSANANAEAGWARATGWGGAAEFRKFPPLAERALQRRIEEQPQVGVVGLGLAEGAAFEQRVDGPDRLGGGHVSLVGSTEAASADAPLAQPPATVARHPHARIPTEHLGPIGRDTVVQIQQRYLVCEVPEGMVVIDQHALHERILYEELKTKILSGNIESQKLLVPQPVDLTATEAAAVLEVRDDLEKLGMGVEDFGGGTLLITSYPSLLQSQNLGELIRVIVDQLVAGKQRPDPQDWFDHMLATMACKAAVKAGDWLSQPEMVALIQHRDLCHDAHHCPHGRPSWLVFSQEELDKKFKRI